MMLGDSKLHAASSEEIVTDHAIEIRQAHERFKAFRYGSDVLDFEVIEHGGIVSEISVPDRFGEKRNVLLRCRSLEGFLGNHPHLNCLVGRYANRMTNARFVLDGREHALDANIPPHHLHGGSDGLGQRCWRGEVIDRGVELRVESAAGEGGYPGALEVVARYEIDGRRLRLCFEAVTDAPTPVSLTSHHYYNLSGDVAATADDHEVQIHADHFLPVSDALTQLGEIRSVDGTPFDLRKPVRIGDQRRRDDEQLQLVGKGFDHTFVLRNEGLRREGLREAAMVRHAGSGRTLTISTDQPGVQLYTGNTLDDFRTETEPWLRYGALCLETQQFPDAPNHAGYPNAILRPGEVFRAETVFEFSVSD